MLRSYDVSIMEGKNPLVQQKYSTIDWYVCQVKIWKNCSKKYFSPAPKALGTTQIMDRNIENTFKKFGKLKIGVFVDNSNLYHAQKDAGWWIDWKKFKLLLQKQLNISFYNFYIAIPNKSDVDYRSTKAFIDKLKKFSTWRGNTNIAGISILTILENWLNTKINPEFDLGVIEIMLI